MALSEYDLDNKLWHWMTLEEERAYYEEVCQRVINNPRFYLDNLDDLYVFRCSFIGYTAEKFEEMDLEGKPL